MNNLLMFFQKSLRKKKITWKSSWVLDCRTAGSVFVKAITAKTTIRKEVGKSWELGNLVLEAGSCFYIVKKT